MVSKCTGCGSKKTVLDSGLRHAIHLFVHSFVHLSIHPSNGIVRQYACPGHTKHSGCS